MKLGVKIGLGFGVLLAIAITLGAIAIIEMGGVKTESVALQNEYVPEVDIAGKMQRNTFQAMYAMRGYAYTGEEEMLKSGNEHLKNLDEHIATANDLANKAQHLKALKPALLKVTEIMTAYDKLVEQTAQINKTMNDNEAQLEAMAKQYMESCDTYLKGQNGKMADEITAAAPADKLSGRLTKITLINQIISLGDDTQRAFWKAQSQRDP